MQCMGIPSRRWIRGQHALCFCHKREAEECVVLQGTGDSTSAPTLQRFNEVPHACTTAKLVDRRGRPGEASRTCRLSTAVLDSAASCAKVQGVPLREWIEATLRQASSRAMEAPLEGEEAPAEKPALS